MKVNKPGIKLIFLGLIVLIFLLKPLFRKENSEVPIKKDFYRSIMLSDKYEFDTALAIVNKKYQKHLLNELAFFDIYPPFYYLGNYEDGKKNGIWLIYAESNNKDFSSIKQLIGEVSFENGKKKYEKIYFTKSFYLEISYKGSDTIVSYSDKKSHIK